MNDAARFVGATALWSVLVLFLFGDETSGDLLQLQAAALTLALVCAVCARLTRPAPTPPACPCRNYGAECVALARDYAAHAHGQPRREDTTP